MPRSRRSALPWLALLLLASVVALAFRWEETWKAIGAGKQRPALDVAQVPDDGDQPPTFLVEPYLQLPTPTSMTVMWETNRKLPGKVEYGPTPDLGQVVELDEEKALHEAVLTGLKPATTYHYRVSSGPVTSEVFSFRTAPEPGTKRWRMALYGDSRSNPATHRKVAEGVRQAGVDLIVHTGDIVTNGKDHPSWRREFFEPLGPLARSVPWVATIGNHERDPESYFSYAAMPGKGAERRSYFALDYANAHIVCLDSNAWIQKGRDSEQAQWLREDLAKPRPGIWTFVVFHHPLFSAHATRPINSLRWDWAPTFLEPDNRVDGVLTGHDHFYARNWRMGRLADGQQRGVLFLTSAGGGAGLYRCKERDYTARARSVHHFSLFDFDGDRVTITATDVGGRQIDRYVLTREPVPADEFCAYEVEELRNFLGLALARLAPTPAAEEGPTRINTSLRVPTSFRVPVSGKLQWADAPGWKLPQKTLDFKLEPAQPLIIPIEAEVAPGPFLHSPELTIAFEAGRFRNCTIVLSPCLLAGPSSVEAGRADRPLEIDGKLTEAAWVQARVHDLLGLPPAGRADRVRLLADRDWIYVGVGMDDPEDRVKVERTEREKEGGRIILSGEHVHVVLSDGKQKHTFAVNPQQFRYHEATPEGDETVAWRAAAAAAHAAWTAEFAIPRKLFSDWSAVRVNVVHRRGSGLKAENLLLCPAWTIGKDPDRLPDCLLADQPDRWARLVVQD
jgi:hypothetical protein